MNLLFVCDLDYTILYREIAGLFKKKFDYKCDALIGGKLFYERFKNDQNFSKTWYFQEIYGENEQILSDMSWGKVLEEIEVYERNYGRPTLLSAALSDRTFCDLPREDRARRVIGTYKRIESFLDNYKPDFVISSGFEALPHYIFSDVCQYKKIPIFYFLGTRISNFWSSMYNQYQESPFHGIKLNLEPSNSSILKAKKYVDSYFKEQHAPENEALIPYDNYKIGFNKIYNFTRYLYRYYVSKTYANDHAYLSPIKKLNFEIKNRVKRFSHKFLNYSNLPDDIENWYYFPLHIQPEYTTLIAGTNAKDQIGTIISLSNSLSLGEGIIVKEHPGMLGRRSRRYYKKLMELSNVIIVKPSTSTFELIKKTKGLITINGTAGMEAALLGKPVITIGNVFYNNYYNILKLKDIPRRKWAENILLYTKEFNFDKTKLIKYVAQVMSQSSSFYFVEPNNSDVVIQKENINKIFKHLNDEIKKLIADKNYGLQNIENKSYI